MMETYKYLGKTVFYLKESSDGFCYLSSLTVFAVNETTLFDKYFTLAVEVKNIFENYKDAKTYMDALGIELYISSEKIGFKKIYKSGNDLAL